MIMSSQPPGDLQALETTSRGRPEGLSGLEDVEKLCEILGHDTAIELRDSKQQLLPAHRTCRDQSRGNSIAYVEGITRLHC